jgi:hypothetical protein
MDPYRSPDELDLDNPYAPPRSSFQPEEAEKAESHGVSIPFTIDSIVTTAWEIFKARLGICLGLVWGAQLVNIGLALALLALNAGLTAAMPDERGLVMFIYWTLYVCNLIFQAWLAIGMTRGLLKVVHGEPVSFDVLFSGGPYLIRVCLGSILYFVVFVVLAFVPVIVLGVVAGVLANNTGAGIALMVVAVPLFVGFVLYMSARLMQFYYLIIDRDAGVVESLQQSWQITTGRAGTIILIFLVQMVVVVAGFLALCVGLIFAGPLSSLLAVVTFAALTGKPKPPPRAEFTAWDDPV